MSDQCNMTEKNPCDFTRGGKERLEGKEAPHKQTPLHWAHEPWHKWETGVPKHTLLTKLKRSLLSMLLNLRFVSSPGDSEEQFPPISASTLRSNNPSLRWPNVLSWLCRCWLQSREAIQLTLKGGGQQKWKGMNVWRQCKESGQVQLVTQDLETWQLLGCLFSIVIKSTEPPVLMGELRAKGWDQKYQHILS